MKSNKSFVRTGIAVVLLIVVMACMWFVYKALTPDTDDGLKTITVEITLPDEGPKNYTIETDAEYLRGALEQESLIAGEESAYGLYVKEVCGVLADESAQEFWQFSKDGEALVTGVDEAVIQGGDHFEITLENW